MTNKGRVRRPFAVKVTNTGKPGHAVYDVELEYDATRPYEIRMFFSNDDDDNSDYWMFARDLLKDGAQRAGGIAGLMDVQLWNDGVSRLFVKLSSSPEESATLEFSLTRVRQFLFATRRIVPYGQEEMDIDHVVMMIFRKEAEW